MQILSHSRPEQKDPATTRDSASQTTPRQQINKPSLPENVENSDQKPNRIRRFSNPTKGAASTAPTIKRSVAPNTPRIPAFTSLASKTQKYQEKLFRRSISDESILRPLSSSTISSPNDSDTDDFTADSTLDSAESMGSSINQRFTGRVRASTLNITSKTIVSGFGIRPSKSSLGAPAVGKEQVVSIYRNAVYDPVVFNVLAVEPKVIAGQLALIDSALFRKIEESELRSLAWTGVERFTLSPNIVKMTNGFNHVALWVSQEIVDCRQEKRRLQKINYFIAVARACLTLKNFNGLKSVLTGLECSPVHRLKGTWAMVNKREKNLLEKLSKLMSPDNNTHYYRRRLEKVNCPCIPYLGLYLMDLTFMVEARKTEKGGSLAAREMQITSILAQCRRFQENCRYEFEELASIRDVLVTEKYINELQFFWEDKHYAKSYQIEPKASTSASNKIASKPSTHNVSLLTSYDDNSTRKCKPARNTHVTIDLITGQSARFSESLTAAGLDLAISRSMGEFSVRSRETREGMNRVVLSVRGFPPRRNALGGIEEGISPEEARTRHRTFSDAGVLVQSTPSRIGEYHANNSEKTPKRRNEHPTEQLPFDSSPAQAAPTFGIPDYNNDNSTTSILGPSSIATSPRKIIVRSKSALSVASSIFSNDSDSEKTEEGQIPFTSADNDFDISSSSSFRSIDSTDESEGREGIDFHPEIHGSPRQRSVSFQQKSPISASREYGHDRRSSADYSTKPAIYSRGHKFSASASAAIPRQPYVQKSLSDRLNTATQNEGNTPTAPPLVSRSLSFSATDSASTRARIEQRTSADTSTTPDDLVAPLKRTGILYKKDRSLSDGRRAKHRDWRKVYAVLQGSKVKFYEPPPYFSSVGSSLPNSPSLLSPGMTPSVGGSSSQGEPGGSENASSGNAGRPSIIGAKWARWRESGSVSRPNTSADPKGKKISNSRETENVRTLRVDVPRATKASPFHLNTFITLPLLEVAEFVPPCSISRATDYKKRPFVLRLRPNKNGEMLLRCKDEVSMKSWSDDIEKSMVKLTTRKGNLIALNSTHPTS